MIYRSFLGPQQNKGKTLRGKGDARESISNLNVRVERCVYAENRDEVSWKSSEPPANYGSTKPRGLRFHCSSPYGRARCCY